jgi:hypothetical protein
MTVYTDRGAIPTPELDEPPHGPDQMAALADRVAGLFNAPRVTETERDAIEGDDLYDGRLVMIVDSNGEFVRIDAYHADDTSDPAAGGTWQSVSVQAALSTHKTDEVHDQPQVPQAHSHDYLALDGSNSPSDTIDWANHSLQNVVLDKYEEPETLERVSYSGGIANIYFDYPVQRIEGGDVEDLTDFAFYNITNQNTWQSVLLWLQKGCPNSVTWPAEAGFEGGNAPDLSQGDNFLVFIARDPNRVAVLQTFANLSGGGW